MKWHPVRTASDVPSSRGWYLVTGMSHKSRRFVDVGQPLEKWQQEGREPRKCWDKWDVLAWAELPEPWKGK